MRRSVSALRGAHYCLLLAFIVGFLCYAVLFVHTRYLSRSFYAFVGVYILVYVFDLVQFWRVISRYREIWLSSEQLKI